MLSDEDKQWITARLETLQSEFSERIEGIETSLRTELRKGVTPAELRQQSHAAVLRVLAVEMEYPYYSPKNLEGR